MDIPQAPADQELRNIIEKLAQFVARNGPEFEQLTKEKQRDNPKFSFLFAPGEYYGYYQYRVSTEQAALGFPVMRSRQMVGPGPPGPTAGGPGMMPNAPPPPVWSPAPIPPTFNGPSQEEFQMQIQKLQEQIQQSEQNLTAQHQVITQQQQEQIQEAIKAAQRDDLIKLAMDCGLVPEEFDMVLQPIIDSCTKDSISAGKSWIFSHADKPQNHEFISKYLLRRSVDEENTFVGKLHLIYLINDVLHHCVRKNADELRKSLESAVVPMFCNSCMSANNEQQPKLAKLLKLWESKQQYFDSSVIEKLRNPHRSWQEYESDLIATYRHVVQPITTQINASYENYQQQHTAFVTHATQQIQELQQQMQQQQIQQQQQQQQLQQQHQQQHQEMMQQMYNQQQQQQQQQQQHHLPPPPQQHQPPPQQQFPPAPPPPNIGPQTWQPEGDAQLPNVFQPPPGFQDYEYELEDLADISKPPPGYQPEFVSSLPYYELPAGLMCPLVKLEDSGYKPLDPALIRLPPPCPPSDRLLVAVEMFYSPPSHDRPRNSEGWEQLALYEYYKAKNAAKKKKEKDIEEGRRIKSRSPTPIRRSVSRSRSRSRSPAYRRQGKPSPRRSLSPVPAHLRRAPGRRSPSPPSFASLPTPVDRKLDESNKGHQMLKKMGWKGEGGLGVKGQGIENPISGGEVRDKGDMYKGVGVNLNDPYETFRKSKGQAFINRMKARAEERM